MAPAAHPLKTFTLAEANAMLPLVRAIAADLVSLSSLVRDRQDRLADLTHGREVSSGDPYSDEVAEMERTLLEDERRIREFVRELSELGVELVDGELGQVDFRSTLAGRDVLLCWQYDEPVVGWWRELGAGFDQRHELDAPQWSEAN